METSGDLLCRGNGIVQELRGLGFCQRLSHVEVIGGFAIEQFTDVHEESDEILKRVSEIQVELCILRAETGRDEQSAAWISLAEIAVQEENVGTSQSEQAKRASLIVRP